MEGRGKDLLDLFIRNGCTEAKSDDIKGDDLGKTYLLLYILIYYWAVLAVLDLNK